MYAITKTLVVSLLAAGIATSMPELLSARNGCGDPGIGGGACVHVYAGPDCQHSTLISQHGPGKCNRECQRQNYRQNETDPSGPWIVDPIGSVLAVGDGNRGTNCMVYTDPNCQVQAGETGSAIDAGGNKCFKGLPDSVQEYANKAIQSYVCLRDC
ncbi:Uu.00g089160.m01.CDS01 [Anthostomella pinea]|uniref:Uu.00g089160.m01.CDS01 n=1 Tax=Anthostomella pinea TaxID=933095 RepID=A0AAI8VMN5_9PEZI|nr:Uu.00g089160.m01.CDS01 [Anthostomella pinea]